MKVRATAIGFFGNRRIKPGQVFEIKDLKIKTVDPKTKKEMVKTVKAEDQFSEVWMEKIDADEAKKIANTVPKFDYEDNIKEEDVVI